MLEERGGFDSVEARDTVGTLCLGYAITSFLSRALCGRHALASGRAQCLHRPPHTNPSWGELDQHLSQASIAFVAAGSTARTCPLSHHYCTRRNNGFRDSQ